MKDTSQNFNFFIDDLKIEKAKDNKGNDVMKIGGVASTQDQDSDGEYLDPSGFDVSYFMDHGYINYNHQAKLDPEAVIGEPTSARVTSKGLEIEATLYPDNPLAQKVYSTTQMLEKSSKNRRMGFSIEGKAVERDISNPKRIKKAMITGCAVTLNPKNPSTLVNIMKGEYSDEVPVYDFKEVDGKDLSISKAQEENLVELEKDGKKIIIDKGMNIKIMDLKSKKDDKTEKSLSTESCAATIKEDVDREVKNIEGIDKPRKKGKFLSKGEAYNQIFNYIYKCSDHSDVIEKAKLVYELTESIVRKNNMETNLDNVKVTKEDISKAFEVIQDVASKDNSEGLEKGMPSKKDVKKSEEEMPEDPEMEKKDEKESYDDEDVEKALSEDEEYMKMKKACDDYKKSYKSKMEKGEVSGYPATQSAKETTMQSDENAASIGKEGEFIKKSEEGGEAQKSPEAPAAEFNKGFVDELVKGISSTIEASQEKSNEILKSLGTIAKGTLEQTEKIAGENKDLKKSLEDALERLEKVEETPIPSRTVQTQSYREKESFAKSHDAAKGSNVLHGKANRGEIMDIIEARCGFDGGTPNKKFMKSLQLFESENAIEKSVLSDLSREGINIEGVHIL